MVIVFFWWVSDDQSGFAGVHTTVLWPYRRPASHWSHVRRLLLSLVHFFSSRHPASEQQSARISWMLLTPPTPGTQWHMIVWIIDSFNMSLPVTFTLYSYPGGMVTLMLFICRECSLVEEQHIISLWCHNLPSLEESVLTLLESVLTNKESSPQKLEQLLEQTLLVGHFSCITTSNVQSLTWIYRMNGASHLLSVTEFQIWNEVHARCLWFHVDPICQRWNQACGMQTAFVLLR